MSSHDKTSSVEAVLWSASDLSQHNESDSITVHNRPVQVTFWNPTEGEMLCFWQITVDDCNEEGFGVPYKDPCSGFFVCLCCEQTTYILKHPGRYKLVKYGETSNSHVTTRFLSNRFL